MKTIVCLILSCVGGGSLGTMADIEQATVTLPYSELLSLLERANPEMPVGEDAALKPPVDVVVESAHYRLSCVDPQAAKLEATFSVSNLSEAWQSVMLVEASEAIRSIEPAEAKLVKQGGEIHLLLEPKAVMIVTLGLQPEQVVDSWSGSLIADFFAVGAAQSLLTITHEGDPAAVMVTGAIGSNQEKTVFSLPASGGNVQVKLYEPKAVTPTLWSAYADHLIRDSGGLMEVNSHVQLTATDGGRPSRAKLRVASPASVISVGILGTGRGARHSVEMTVDGPAIHLNWPNDEAMVREVLVQYTVPVNMAEGTFSVPLLKVAEAVKMDSTSYVTDFEGVDVKPSEESWLEASRLPAWVREETGMQRLHYLATSDRQSLELTARLLPRAKTASATVVLAEYTTEVVAEGGMLHKSNVTIEHTEASEYPFKLPQGSKLLSCTINGRAAEPLLAEDGGLILTLPKVSGLSETAQVGYVFTTKGDKMNPVEGKAQLELPRTPLFIYKLTWMVQLPVEYQATALKGNVVIEEGGSNGESVRLSKQICDDETPFASLYYTRRDLQR